MTGLTLEVLNEAVKGSAAAFRCRRRLQPAGLWADSISPAVRSFGGAFGVVQQVGAERRSKAAPAPMATVLRNRRWIS